MQMRKVQRIDWHKKEEIKYIKIWTKTLTMATDESKMTNEEKNKGKNKKARQDKIWQDKIIQNKLGRDKTVVEIDNKTSDLI